MQDVICQAIKEKRLLELQYDGHARRVAPHVYGIDAAGDELLNCYEVWGGTTESRQVGGRCDSRRFAADAHDKRFAPRRNISAATAHRARLLSWSLQRVDEERSAFLLANRAHPCSLIASRSASRRARVVDPFAQQRAAVDHVDREPVVLVLVREVAPDRIVRLQLPQRLERERLQAPRAERVVIVARDPRRGSAGPRRACRRACGRSARTSTRAVDNRAAIAARAACIVASSARASMSGAPNSSSGRVVPRPSDSVVPSSITVPA